MSPSERKRTTPLNQKMRKSKIERAGSLIGKIPDLSRVQNLREKFLWLGNYKGDLGFESLVGNLHLRTFHFPYPFREKLCAVRDNCIAERTKPGFVQ